MTVFIFIGARSIMLHLCPAKDLDPIAAHQYNRSLKLSPFRGTIFDRRNIPLAISYRRPSIAANPRIFNPSPQLRRFLAQTLALDEDKLKKIAARDKYFSWVKRKASPDEWNTVKAKNIKGLYRILEPSRFYPQGTNAAHLIGFVGTDNTGLIGLESVFEKEISGVPQSVHRLRDAKGRWIFLNSEYAAPEKQGYHHFLTLDSVIQDITEKALAKWRERSQAKRAFALVSDPHTGRILAVANQPSFDPNDLRRLHIADTANFAFSGLIEPGSIIKPLVIAAALERSLVKPNESHNCEKTGAYQLSSGEVIHDDHPIAKATTAQVLAQSSNICTFKIAQLLGKKGLYRAYRQFGLAGESPLIAFPGALAGRIADPRSWTEIRYANIAFGQGFLASGLEIIQAYSAFANGGKLATPFVLDKIENDRGELIFQATPQSKTILPPSVVAQMKLLLQGVVEDGTATAAKSTLYSTAGKTGTAEKYDPKTKSYADNMRIANFIGFAPVGDPHLLVYIVLDEPQKKPYYGGKWAAPAFREIVDHSLKYLNVPSDMVRISSR